MPAQRLAAGVDARVRPPRAEGLRGGGRGNESTRRVAREGGRGWGTHLEAGGRGVDVGERCEVAAVHARHELVVQLLIRRWGASSPSAWWSLCGTSRAGGPALAVGVFALSLGMMGATTPASRNSDARGPASVDRCQRPPRGVRLRDGRVPGLRIPRAAHTCDDVQGERCKPWGMGGGGCFSSVEGSRRGALKAHLFQSKISKSGRPLPPHCYLGGGCSHQIQAPPLVVASAAIETAALVSL